MSKRKRVLEAAANVDEDNDQNETQEIPRFSDDRVAKRAKWVNRERVLVLGSRGISHRDRHLMLNMRDMLPHSKAEAKCDPKDPVHTLNEIAEMRNCTKCLFFEGRKKQDLYMWMANIGEGPSVKFLVENMHTMDEMRMTGNCLKGSRPLLSFDPLFDKTPHHQLMKEMLVQMFGTPNFHPKSQPFIDHVMTFTLLDNRIWFRNFQILDEVKGELAEIGPRFALNPIKIFDGPFRGTPLWTSPTFISPFAHRMLIKRAAAGKYKDRIEQKLVKELRQPGIDAYVDNDPAGEVFETIAPEEAKGVMKNVFNRKETGKPRISKRAAKKKKSTAPEMDFEAMD